MNLMKFKNLLFLLALLLGVMVTNTPQAKAHCEVPCGIYNDSLRIELVKEHIQTIKKSMHEIEHLSTENKTDLQQMVRWVNNKEKHAIKIQEIMTQYFLYQRVKIGTNKVTQERTEKLLVSLHKVCVYAMKCKQSLDHKYIDKLQNATLEFEKLYFNP